MCLPGTMVCQLGASLNRLRNGLQRERIWHEVGGRQINRDAAVTDSKCINSISV